MGYHSNRMVEIMETYHEDIVKDWNEQFPDRKVQEVDEITDNHKDGGSFVCDWCADHEAGEADHAYDCWKDAQIERSMEK
ncbi:hypothetical protein CMI37_11095 [Candidatus Pacearchaeota archaeon]|nr:hypothetical protein [Candidatus Pacearchaeota archaeon]